MGGRGGQGGRGGREPGRARSHAGAGSGVPVRLLLVVVVAVAVVGSAGAGPAAAQAPAAATARAGSPSSAGTTSGRWQWPLAPRPRVLRPFAPGPTRYSPGHYGVDLAASSAQPVLAAGAGRVTYAGLLAGRGVVVVEHGGLRTTYEPVDATVRLGARVDRGAVLGRVGTGHACPGGAFCLHWGLRRGADHLDPLRLLGGPVRLLPQGSLPAGLRLAAPGPTGEGAPARPAPVPLDPSVGPPPGAALPPLRPVAVHPERLRDRVGGAAALLGLLAGLVLLSGRRPPSPSGGAATAARGHRTPPTATAAPGDALPAVAAAAADDPARDARPGAPHPVDAGVRPAVPAGPGPEAVVVELDRERVRRRPAG